MQLNIHIQMGVCECGGIPGAGKRKKENKLLCMHNVQKQVFRLGEVLQSNEL